MKRPAIFLDRDGTLIEDVNYLARVEDLRIFPFVGEALKILKDAGFLLVVVTNQSGIGRGIYDEAAMHSIHDAIQVELDDVIDGFYFCPHLPCDGCLCRKPAPGMIKSALADIDIDLESSWMVGDKKADVEAARAAGIRSVLVLTGYGMQHRGSLAHEPTLVADDLAAAAAVIVASTSSEVVV